jgi:hypothetical protein
LSYWEILVLAAARLGCNYDYDQLQDLAENHPALRQVMGIGDGLRNVFCLAAMLAGLFGLDGWRQKKYLYRKARRLVRKIERIAAGRGPGGVATAGRKWRSGSGGIKLERGEMNKR